MEYWISAGIPCGKMDNSDQYHVYYRNQQYSMPAIGYQLWNSLLISDTLEHAYNSLGIQTEEEKQLAYACISDFEKIGLIIPLKNAWKQVPLRQGVGLGFVEEDTYAIQCSKTINVPFLCYYIWCYSDGKNTLLDIHRKMKEQDMTIEKETLLKAFVLLVQTEALALA